MLFLSLASEAWAGGEAKPYRDACEMSSSDLQLADGYIDLWPEDSPPAALLHIHQLRSGRAIREGDYLCFYSQQGKKDQAPLAIMAVPASCQATEASSEVSTASEEESGDNLQGSKHSIKVGGERVCSHVEKVSHLGAWVKLDEDEVRRLRRCDLARLEVQPAAPLSEFTLAYIYTQKTPYSYHRLVYLPPTNSSPAHLWGSSGAVDSSTEGVSFEWTSQLRPWLRPAVGLRLRGMPTISSTAGYDYRSGQSTQQQYAQEAQISERASDYGSYLDFYAPPLISVGELSLLLAAGLDLDYSSISFSAAYLNQLDSSKDSQLASGQSAMTILSARGLAALKYESDGWAASLSSALLRPLTTLTQSYIFGSTNSESSLLPKGEKADSKAALDQQKSPFGLEIIFGLSRKF